MELKWGEYLAPSTLVGVTCFYTNAEGFLAVVSSLDLSIER